MSVDELTTLIISACGSEQSWRHVPGAEFHEAALLTLDAGRARTELGCKETLPLTEAVNWTVEWYKAVSSGRDPGVVAQARIAHIRDFSAN